MYQLIRLIIEELHERCCHGQGREISSLVTAVSRQRQRVECRVKPSVSLLTLWRVHIKMNYYESHIDDIVKVRYII